MICNVSEYLDRSAERYPMKKAFIDSKRGITFSELRNEACHIANGLIKRGCFHKPVAVYMEKNVESIASFIGVSKSRNFYAPIDVRLPEYRIQKMREILQPEYVIVDEESRKNAEKLFGVGRTLSYEKLQRDEVNIDAVNQVQSQSVDSDLLCVLFTSGSTGVPKGVMITQRGVINTTEWATEYIKISDSDVFANQVPFYAVCSTHDIYLTLRNGASTYIVPPEHFKSPIKLMHYLYDSRVTMLIWVPSALCILSTLRMLSSPHLSELRGIWFGGEPMSLSQLSRWREEYPNIQCYPHYGQTETSGLVFTNTLKQNEEVTGALPLGHTIKNMEALIITEDGALAEPGQTGELYVRGCGLSPGYYRDTENTARVFVQNPLHSLYPDTVFKTGDIVKVGLDGTLYFAGRMDHQIKRMGYRIELGEVEAAAAVEGLDMSCCLYDEKRTQIALFYTGSISEAALNGKLQKVLPTYMLPNRLVRLSEMPLNATGKIDRRRLKDEFFHT